MNWLKGWKMDKRRWVFLLLFVSAVLSNRLYPSEGLRWLWILALSVVAYWNRIRRWLFKKDLEPVEREPENRTFDG